MAKNIDDNTLKILIATDCHLGYKENDAVRGNDSYNTFAEILEHAQKQKVDMVLLGGDLFHKNTPSRKTRYVCMELIKKHCIGKKPTKIKIMSNRSQNSTAISSFPLANSEEERILNMQIPVFSIHGNHDNPTGPGYLCELDVLSLSGLVYHFGKTKPVDPAGKESVRISPLIIQKGSTKMALYGLGSLRDRRCYEMFTNEKFEFEPPKADGDTCHNIFVIHQNRVQRGSNYLIPEEILPAFLDLVIWGHEHDCREKDPVWNPKGFYVTQPGSSIATAFKPGESLTKHVGLLELGGTTHPQTDAKELLRVEGKATMKYTRIPLKTVRPFYMEKVVLQELGFDPSDAECAKKVEDFCHKKVTCMISKAEAEHTDKSKLPLIRLTVDYRGGFKTFSEHRFGLKFDNKVANPSNIIYFPREKDTLNSAEEVTINAHPEDFEAHLIMELVKKHFESGKQNHMLTLSEEGLWQALNDFVNCEEKEAIKKYISMQMGVIQQELKKRGATGENVVEEVIKIRAEREHQWQMVSRNPMQVEEMKGNLQTNDQG